jgi:hypothetical protein
MQEMALVTDYKIAVMEVSGKTKKQDKGTQ